MVTRKILPIVFLPLVLTACAETQFVVNGAKELSRSEDVSRGQYKVGKPYQIAGTWYYPSENFEYVETGIASWYGPNFHGKFTANGETYDMNALTAAHRTLPMPSVVRVVNLENGRSIMVRVNDRGPFAKGRIIDMSRRAAQLLGFQNRGTARVRVEIVPGESQRLKMLAMNGTPPSQQRILASAATGGPVQAAVPAPSASAAEPSPIERPVIRSAALPPVTVEPRVGIPPAAQPASAPEPASTAGSPPKIVEEVVARGPVTATSLFVQAGAFVDYANASKVRSQLAGSGPSWVSETQVGSQKFYRVRVGPLGTVERADAVLEQVIAAGYPQAQIVVD